MSDTPALQRATLGGGCFWCLEAVFDDLIGVSSVESGYMGGHVDNPTYAQVCGADTGHAEVVQINFDPTKVSFRDILAVFFVIHDPTTLNRQGNDAGPQYRSAIFFHTPEQERESRAFIAELAEREVFARPVVTEVTAASKFWIAENYHQEYFVQHGHEPYCQYVVAPKVAKFRKEFAAMRKSA
jgi:peptide-methionine (S)-S-oxide reductase